MAHEMIEEGKLANEKQKNIQAAAEFWADMRKTHGFLNQTAGLEVQVAAMTEESVRKPGLLQNNKWKPPSRAGTTQKEERDQTMNTKIRLPTPWMPPQDKPKAPRHPPVNTQSQSQ